MEEIEVPLEDAQEHMAHHAEHGPKWIGYVALSSAILAVLAAITALLAGHHANEAMIQQIRASDNWSYYQAKSIKASVLSSKLDLLAAIGKPAGDDDKEKFAEYKKDMEEAQKGAKEKEHDAEDHMAHHQVYARGVTMFQVAIATAAIAAMTRRKRFWMVGMLFGLIGAGFLVQGLFFA